MAYEGYFTFDGIELGNWARLQAYSNSMVLPQVRIVGDFDWLRQAVGDDPYTIPAGDPAPWYDPYVPESGQFGGVFVLSAEGLDDDSRTANGFEYTTDGGNPGQTRKAMKSVVFTAALVGNNEAAVEYGLRWLKSLLNRNTVNYTGTATLCNGAELSFFRARYSDEAEFDQADYLAENRIRMRNVTCTRGPQVTRKRTRYCDTVWMVTFTLVAGDPWQYGDPKEILEGLGTEEDPYVSPWTGTAGYTTFTETPCPVFVWSPIYDPLYPAAVAPPEPPDYFPEGWDIEPGSTWERFWATIPVQAGTYWDQSVPIITLTSIGSEARMVRVRIYNEANAPAPDTVCTPAWETIISYVPADVPMVIDCAQRVIYVIDVGPQRADSLVFGTDATPIQWPALADSAGGGTEYWITLEQAVASAGMADLSMSLSFVPRSA